MYAVGEGHEPVETLGNTPVEQRYRQMPLWLREIDVQGYATQEVLEAQTEWGH